MKHVFTAMLLATFAFSANATYCKDGSLIESHPNHDCNKPIPPKNPPPVVTPTPIPAPVNATSAANAAAQAAAQAAAIAGGGAGGMGGQGGAGGMGGASSAVSGPSSANAEGGKQKQQQQQQLSNVSPSTSGITDSSRFLSLALPGPVFTPPMAKIECPSAHLTQMAVQVLGPLFSYAQSEADSSDCTLLNLRNAMIEQCRYKSASMLEARLTAKYIKDFPQSETFYIDLTRDECLKLNAPIVNNITNNYATNYLESLPFAECPKAAPIVKTKRKALKRVVPVDICEHKK